jgi:hypothetical protein
VSKRFEAFNEKELALLAMGLTAAVIIDDQLPHEGEDPEERKQHQISLMVDISELFDEIGEVMEVPGLNPAVVQALRELRDAGS